jgi:hypothetical protein
MGKNESRLLSITNRMEAIPSFLAAVGRINSFLRVKFALILVSYNPVVHSAVVMEILTLTYTSPSLLSVSK